MAVAPSFALRAGCSTFYFATIWLSFLESSLPLKGLIWKGIGFILIMDGGLIPAFWAFRSAGRVVGARLEEAHRTVYVTGYYRIVGHPCGWRGGALPSSLGRSMVKLEVGSGYSRKNRVTLLTPIAAQAMTLST